MLPKVVANTVVVLVSLVWVANFFAQFLVNDYHPDPSINGVFGAIVGGALALTRRGNGNSGSSTTGEAAT